MNVYWIPQTLLTAVFLRAILLGVLLGGLYDLSRAPRRAFDADRCARGVGTALLDGAFLLALLALLFRFFVVEAYGVPRGWFVCGIGLGTVLYFATLSPLILLVLVAVLTLLRKLVAVIGGGFRRVGVLLQAVWQTVFAKTRKFARCAGKNFTSRWPVRAASRTSREKNGKN